MAAYAEDLRKLLDQIDTFGGAEDFVSGSLTDSSGNHVEFVREDEGDPGTVLVVKVLELAE